MARKTLLEAFLTMFGDIKVFPWKRPCWLLYQPEGYQVRGTDIRAVLGTIREGDVVVRGFKDYLDGRFIPGYFSHVGLYIGEVTDADREQLRKPAKALGGKDAEPLFRTGKQMVIHAIAEGVRLEDVIDFCRCDYMTILRFPAVLRRTSAAEQPLLDPKAFSAQERAIRDRLNEGKEVPFAEALPCIKAAALGKLGASYDFSFDFRRFNRLSCSELVYFATRSIAPFHCVQAHNHRVLLWQRSMIEPDAFVRSPLEVAWKSPSVDAAAFAALRTPAPQPAPAAPLRVA